MKASTKDIRSGLGAIASALTLGASVLLATACGAGADDGLGNDIAFDDGVEEVEQLGEAISGGWTTVSLINGWQNYNSTDPPAVGVVDGVVRFRGAVRGPSATSTCAFVLPSQFRSYFTGSGQTHVGADQLYMRTVMSGSAGGSLLFEPDIFAGQSPTKNCIHLLQDGVSGIGSAAKNFTSLDGVTYDRTMDNSTVLAHASWWASVYPLRQHGQDGAYVKKVDGFVRFQGALGGSPTATGYLFTLPSTYRPGQAVYVPVTLCPGANGKYGRLKILSNGDTFVQGDLTAARCLTSLEGASYSLTGGGTTLTLLNNWVQYSARAVKARLEDGMVRFEGAVKSGTSITIARLPSNMRPSRTVYLASDSSGATQGRVYVNSSGYVNVQYPSLTTSSKFTSLDGLSFGL